MTIDSAPELKQAFRDASGITYAYEQELAEINLRGAILPWRGLVGLFHLIVAEDYQRSAYLRESGRNKLKSLIEKGLGKTYPRSEIYYVINPADNQRSFEYGLIFPGEEAGEKGEVRFTYNPKNVLLRKGIKSVVEIGEAEQILYLSEDEGIILANGRLELDGRRFKRAHDRFAVWKPSLPSRNIPLFFTYPQNGKIVWDIPNQ